MIKKSITKEELNELPLNHFKGEVVVIEDVQEAEKYVMELEQHNVIGFDTETKPSFQKGKINKVALLQFSTSDKSYLFRLNKLGMLPSIVGLFENQNILKVGVGIRDDIKGLNRLKPFRHGGFVELQDYVRVVGIEDISLKKLAGIVLNFRVSKRQRLSNWEMPRLTEGQIVYAATDSWVAIELYKTLTSHFPDCEAETINK